MYSPTTWGPKQRISDYKHHQHSFNMSVEMDDHERKIVNEFCHYLEKSKQLFNGLRYNIILKHIETFLAVKFKRFHVEFTLKSVKLKWL